MSKNNKTFFSMQGNELSFETWYKYIFMGIAFAVLITIFLTKNIIRRRFDKGGNFWFFKSDIALWKTIGYIGLVVLVGRTSLYIYGGYPLYWENLNLHFCRFLMFLVFSLLAAGKPQWLRYIMIQTLLGAFLAFYFTNEKSEYVSYMANNPGKTLSDFKNVIGDQSFKPTTLELGAIAKGFKFYNHGLDSFLTIETLTGHLSILAFPLIAMSAYGTRLTNRELHISYMFGVLAAVSFWLINWGSTLIPDKGWHSNFWYLGTNDSNDNANALGPLTSWPQNIVSYPLMNFVAMTLFQYIAMFLNKFQPFKDGKFMKVQKSEWFADSKKEYSVGFIPYIKTLKINRTRK